MKSSHPSSVTVSRTKRSPGIRLLRAIGKVLAGFLIFLALYAGAALGLSSIAVHKNKVASSGVPMYLLSNGVHLDLVLPVKTPYQDWSQLFPYKHTTGNDTTLSWIGIGWGDKGFYLNTPTWADLKFSTAFKAATALSTSAVHATYLKTPQPGEKCRFLYATPVQYQKLVAYIRQSLDLDAQGNPIWIVTDANYGPDDAFYEARGSYYAFKTCNTWTNKALKQAGMKACLWTLTANPILEKYPL